MKPQFLICPLFPDVGRILLTMGLMRALVRRGMSVQAFECGPDLSDTVCHAVAAGNASVNMDMWYSSRAHVQHLYNTYGEEADVCVIESPNGLFDGYRKWQGSAAEMSQALSVPVVLAVNARNATCSLAPMLYGFKHFRRGIRVAGVIFYHVFSLSQYGFLREICADAGLECFGYLPYSEELHVPPRYSSLTSSVRTELDELSRKAAELMEKTVDFSKLLNMTTRIFPCAYTLPYISEAEFAPRRGKMRIAVASDPAFHFFYRQNLDRLKEMGDISFFSPVYGNDFPQADLIYLPGGYPELFARQLHRWKRQLQNLREYAESGGYILAEGGGITLLAESVAVRQGATSYEMSGLLPFEIVVRDARLYSGYRRTEFQKCILKGYEYRYFDIVRKADCDIPLTFMTNIKGVEVPTSFVCRYKNVIVSTAHCYWEDVRLFDLWKNMVPGRL